MNSGRPQHPGSRLVTAALACVLSFLSQAGAAEFHFVAEERGEKRAAWVPEQAVIHRSTEMQDGLVFILENPMDRTHAFAAYGLFEEVLGAQGEIMKKPLRVNVTSEDTVRVQVSTAQFDGHTDVVSEAFPFFCPLHKGDAHVGGVIHVVP